MSKPKTIFDPHKVRIDDKVIAVMGPTGCGKSYLIDHIMKSTKWSGTSLRSVTQDVRAIRIPLFNKNVVLVDTPGFDDSCRSDVAILELIGEWLKKNYEKNSKLAGILYLHRITDKHVRGTAFPGRNLRLLGKLCGNKPAQRLIFVTTMWDKMPSDEGNRREEELVIHHWQPVLALGARTARFLQGDANCTQDIVKRLVKSDARAILLREGLVDPELAIPEMKTLYNLFQIKNALVKVWERANGEQTVLDDEETYIEAELDKIPNGTMGRLSQGMRLLARNARRDAAKVGVVFTLSIAVLWIFNVMPSQVHFAYDSKAHKQQNALTHPCWVF